ncbi:hydrogenase accessory protein HypB [Leptolinea sp. HRD-7]|jgi:hydrogenase nickel incorporation protein HypB|nr:hydrogenase accessory protein HypB [Leptolinea sp. HRD-7]
MVDAFKVIQIKQSVFADNNRQAEAIRADLKARKTFLLNLMSSPGSGKTTTLMKTIDLLRGEMNIGIVEADVDSDVDAVTIAQTGARVIQVHTGGMCHMDAEMTRQGLHEMGLDNLDLVVLENIGNLLCPAEVDTGAVKNAMILSVPEGDDKPLKYPGMFSMVDVLLVNKIDTLPYFDFDLNALCNRVLKLNPDVDIIPVSARTGEGMDLWADWLRREVALWKQG